MIITNILTKIHDDYINRWTTTEDGQRVITIAHTEHLLRWAKNKHKKHCLRMVSSKNYWACEGVRKKCHSITLWLIKLSLRKHAYSNTLKFYPQKMAIFQIKNSDIFHISAQNIDCGYLLEPPRRGGSNEYPQSMFLSRNNKIMYTSVNFSFTI